MNENEHLEVASSKKINGDLIVEMQFTKGFLR
jgi:hypothetical protein